MTEHELDHVFIGRYDGPVTPNPEEADGMRWAAIDEVMEEISDHPEQYTVWSKIAFEKLLASGFLA